MDSPAELVTVTGLAMSLRVISVERRGWCMYSECGTTVCSGCMDGLVRALLKSIFMMVAGGSGSDCPGTTGSAAGV
jgi:hypothetical protein